MDMKKGEQLELRGDGKLPSILVRADNLAEGVREAILRCYDFGARVETPKHKRGGSLGYDGSIEINVAFPDSEPKVYNPADVDSPTGDMQYILEVTHGIHNHWKKTPQEPLLWGYTYNERFVDQIPFILQRIKNEWEEKGRITGRDYQFTIWRPGEDIILEQEDAPCWQRGQFRFIQNQEGEIVMNYFTDWRSRDLLKAWNQNNIAQVELMKLFRDKTSAMLKIPIELGNYIDHSSSLHLYGLYVDNDGLEEKIELMRKMEPDTIIGSSEFRFTEMSEMGSKEGLMRLIAAQSDAESKGHGKQQSRQKLEELGYNIETFPYPTEWDTWPKSWDA